jgi:hypothetical protein
MIGQLKAIQLLAEKLPGLACDDVDGSPTPAKQFFRQGNKKDFPPPAPPRMKIEQLNNRLRHNAVLPLDVSGRAETKTDYAGRDSPYDAGPT